MPRQLVPLRLTCFGPPAAFVDGKAAPREVQRRKLLAFLIYLGVSPRQRRSRDHLVGIFWPETTDVLARHSLDQAVTLLRQSLGAARLRSDHDVIALSGDRLEIDALRFAALAEAQPEEALTLLAGDFLEGFHLKNAPEFDSWMARERHRYQQLATSTLVAAGARRMAGGRFGDAATAARRALEFAPHAQPAIELLMRATTLAGNSPSALDAFHQYADRLKRDLGEGPGAAVTALAERIRAQELTAAHAVQGGVDPPLVGREEQRRIAIELASQGVRQGPRVLVISGAAGMGRTRLLAECVRHLTLGGALVLCARPVEIDQPARWSAVRLLLRAGLSSAAGLTGARPDTLAALAGLAPDLAERFTPRPVEDVTDMGAVLADAISAVTEARPLAIALDDAHWADASSLAALGGAAASTGGARFVLLLTVAQGVGTPSRELLRLQSDVGRALPGGAIQLDALAHGDLATLVAASAHWCGTDVERDRLARRLMAESGGNPFIAVALLAALAKSVTIRSDLMAWPPAEQTYDASLPFSVPSLLTHAVEVQLTDLTAGQQAILAAASLCGDAFDPDLIAQVADQPVEVVEQALPACEARRLIQFSGGRYTFTAPLIARVVRSTCLVAGERRRLEQRVQTALASRSYSGPPRRDPPGQRA